jgi:hypothetical protein
VATSPESAEIKNLFGAWISPSGHTSLPIHLALQRRHFEWL